MLRSNGFNAMKPRCKNFSFDFNFRLTNGCCVTAAEEHKNTGQHVKLTNTQMAKHSLVNNKMASNDLWSISKRNIGFSMDENGQLSEPAVPADSSLTYKTIHGRKLKGTAHPWQMQTHRCFDKNMFLNGCWRLLTSGQRFALCAKQHAHLLMSFRRKLMFDLC